MTQLITGTAITLHVGNALLQGKVLEDWPTEEVMGLLSFLKHDVGFPVFFELYTIVAVFRQLHQKKKKIWKCKKYFFLIFSLKEED